MDPTFVRSLDESLFRNHPELQNLRIAPLRQPVSSRSLSGPSPLEPNAGGVRESNTVSKTTASSSGTATGSLPTLTELLNAASTGKNDASVDSLVNNEPPPKPILPAFVNPRALERFPYSSFDDDNTHARKRRRLEAQTDSFGEHLQLPIPQAQKEHRPPPFGPFAILNGLNEPPPNAALLPPIEDGSIRHLLHQPRKDSADRKESVPAGKADGQNTDRREGKIEEILDSPIRGKANDTGLAKPEKPPEPKVADSKRREDPKDEAGTTNIPTDKADEPLSPKSRGRSRKNIRRWTEEETTCLLRGVVKCGIGNWKTILAQPELEFNTRTASNLKDR